MSFTELYTTEWCDACKVAKEKLEAAGIAFETVNVDDEDALHRAFEVWKYRLGYNPNTIPQFWYKGTYIGGSSNIDKFLKEQNVN
jgi:glutaredoxin